MAISKIINKSSSQGSRGLGLEKLINHSIDYYRLKHLALIQKIPTPIIPMKYSKDKKLISLARFDKKSTVDYIGIVQEVAICFDAKECEQNRFPIKNIHLHQYNYMKEFEEQGGVAFLIIYLRNDTFYSLFPRTPVYIIHNIIKMNILKQKNANQIFKNLINNSAIHINDEQTIRNVLIKLR